LSPGWRPGDLPGDLATCWRPGDLLATCGCQAHTPRLATLLATHWRPLATAGDLATWRPGDLATCWRPAGDFCWRPGDPGLKCIWTVGACAALCGVREQIQCMCPLPLPPVAVHVAASFSLSTCLHHAHALAQICMCSLRCVRPETCCTRTRDGIRHGH
jgi:hypothetical protein